MLVYSNLPAMPMPGLRREVDRMFEDVFGRSLDNGDRQMSWWPLADVREDQGGFTFTLELPGVAPEKVEVTADNGVLSVRGEKTAERTDGSEGRWLVAERTHGSFVRSFQLPGSADENAIEAAFAHGVLTVRVPKVARPEPRKIAINVRN